MSQQVLILANSWMAETSVKGARDPGPSHICEPNERGVICNMVGECAWLRRWRDEQARAARKDAA